MELEILGMNFSCVLNSLSDGNFPNRDCLLPLISKILGYCIVAASTTVKLPQILKILKHSSVRGLSVAAFELEVVGYTIALSYCLHKGLPFSAYGELLFLLVQAIILVAIIYYYSQPLTAKTWIRPALYCAIAPTILGGRIDPVLFETLYASQHAIFFFARVPQIWKNFTNKSTGELSFLTFFMNFCGSLVRVFTSIQEDAPKSGILRLYGNYNLCSISIIFDETVAELNVVHYCLRRNYHLKFSFIHWISCHTPPPPPPLSQLCWGRPHEFCLFIENLMPYICY